MIIHSYEYDLNCWLDHFHFLYLYRNFHFLAEYLAVEEDLDNDGDVGRYCRIVSERVVLCFIVRTRIYSHRI